MSNQVVNLTKDNFAENINDRAFALVDFWAPWCGPCRAFAPTFEAAAQKHPEVLFAKVNTEDQPELAGYFNIRSIPTLMVFRDNVIVFSQPGALPASALEQVITQAGALDMEEVKREAQAHAEAKSGE